MAAEAENKMFGDPGDDTFLTGLMSGKKPNSARRQSAGSAQKVKETASVITDSDMNPDDIEQELRDVVFDYENSKDLVNAADNFLQGRSNVFYETGSQRTDIRSTNSNTSRVFQNKLDAGSYDPTRIKLM